VETLGGGPARLDGNLALSRALGDFTYKQDTNLPPEKQKCSIEPTVYDWVGQKGDVLFLACDGIYDVMSNDEVADFVRKMISSAEDLDSAAVTAGILQHALDKGTTDNLSSMLCILGEPYEVPEPHLERELRPGKFNGMSDKTLADAYIAFIKRVGFGALVSRDAQGHPFLQCCGLCQRTFQHLHQCPPPCGEYYCTKNCQKIAWKKGHKESCINKTGAAGGKAKKKAAKK